MRALVVLALVVAAPAHAGQGTLRVGLGQEQIREDLIVPWPFVGGGLAVGGGYRNAWGPDSLSSDLLLKLQVVANKQGHLGAVVALDGEVAWDRGVTALAGGELAVGAALHADMDVQLPLYWDDSHQYWLTTYAVGPRAAWRRPVADRAELQLWTSLPALALASRPPARIEGKVEPFVVVSYLIARAHSHPQIASFDRLFAWHGGLAWEKRLERGAMAVRLDSRIVTYRDPERVTLLSHVLTFERRIGGKR